MAAKKFQKYSVKITDKYIFESKYLICSFLLMPLIKTPPPSPRRFLSLPPKQKKIPHSCQAAFSEGLFFPQQKGVGREDYGIEKITEIKPTRELVTSFDKFPYLCNLYIFGFCFVGQ